MVFKPSLSHQNSAFTLIELLVVLSVVALLSALLFPAFMTARGKAQQVVCVSNLRQIGASVALYQQDYDGFFPYAIDPSDRITAAHGQWQPYFPKFAADIPRLPLLREAVQPYAKAASLFRCPSDSGFTSTDKPHVTMNAAPSSFEAFGTSYTYYSMLPACHSSDASLQQPADINVLYDPVGYWHGTLTPIVPRYNVLFADGHVKNLSRDAFDQIGDTVINDTPPEKFDAASACPS